jgi:hypothetical protein
VQRYERSQEPEAGSPKPARINDHLIPFHIIEELMHHPYKMKGFSETYLPTSVSRLRTFFLSSPKLRYAIPVACFFFSGPAGFLQTDEEKKE